MSNTDTTTLAADRVEFDRLMSAAERGGLVAQTAQRMEVLRHRIAAAEGAEAGDELTAAANQLRARGHR
jgi:acyl-CoA reductase-like NAD-dependent aldehyde dehydrogenase